MNLQNIQNKLNSRFPDGFQPLSQLPSPSLLKDVNKSAQRIAEAINKQQKIVIISDYDVDGVISSAIAHRFFKEINYAIEIVIPNRFTEGYGINPEVLKRVNADLVITVDNGINSFASAEILKKQNIDLIITDHHQPAERLPDAFAVVNPKQINCSYPFKDICGAQVFWLLLAELKKVLNIKIDLSKYLDLLTIAIIGDVMPLTGFNHSLVKAGLKAIILNNDNRVYLNTIKEQLFNKNNYISAEDIAFQIAPRINSSGRIDDAIHSLNFLISDNYQESLSLYEKINEFNIKRRQLEFDIFQKVSKQIDNSLPIIIFNDIDLHDGVIGIVASRIVEKYKKPAFVLSQTGEIIKGSARGLGNINIYKLIENASEFLLRWGGHLRAGGMTMHVSQFENFKNSLINSMKIYNQPDFFVEKNIFGEIDIHDISKDLINLLSSFEPFGEGNPRPFFIAHNMIVINSFYIGKNSEYQKLILKNNFKLFEALLFKQFAKIHINTNISFLYQPQLSSFKGEDKVQLIIHEIISS